MSALTFARSGGTDKGWIASALLCLFLITPALGAEPAAKPAITEDARTALKQMSQTLLGKQFSFQARTLRVYADSDGRFLHIGHTMKILVQRPNRMRFDIDGDDGATQVYYDGKTLVLYAPAKKEYVSIPVPDTIEGMVKEGEARVGFDFPLADFLNESPDKAILSGVTDGKIVNEVTIDGAPSNHLALFQPPGLELELWLAKTAQALPERLFITYRSVPGQPNFIAQFSDWNFSVTPTDADFTFQPPEGAKQVELKPQSAAPAKAKGAAQ